MKPNFSEDFLSSPKIDRKRENCNQTLTIIVLLRKPQNYSFVGLSQTTYLFRKKAAQPTATRERMRQKHHRPKALLTGCLLSVAQSLTGLPQTIVRHRCLPCSQIERKLGLVVLHPVFPKKCISIILILSIRLRLEKVSYIAAICPTELQRTSQYYCTQCR